MTIERWIMFISMTVVAMVQVATIRYLWLGLIGTSLLPLMLTVLMKMDRVSWKHPKMIILWAGFFLGSSLGTFLYFAKPLLHKS